MEKKQTKKQTKTKIDFTYEFVRIILSVNHEYFNQRKHIKTPNLEREFSRICHVIQFVKIISDNLTLL